MLTALQVKILKACAAGSKTTDEIRRALTLDCQPWSTVSHLVKLGYLQVVGLRKTPVWHRSGNYLVDSNIYGYTGKKYNKKGDMNKKSKRLRRMGRKTTNGNKAVKNKRRK